MREMMIKHLNRYLSKYMLVYCFIALFTTGETHADHFGVNKRQTNGEER